MREMKDSGIGWVGMIPKLWGVLRIKNMFSIVSGATPSPDIQNWDGDIRWITPADYKTKDKYISKGKRNLSLEGFNACSTSIIPRGSIIFSKRAPIGTVAINTEELCTNQGCLSCIPITDCNCEFFYYVMSVGTEHFELLGTGTTFKEISANNFANCKLPTPPLAEQKRIADFLDGKCSEIDGLVADILSQIDTLEQYKRSVITETVTKGLNPDAEMKDSGIEWVGMIPKNWNVSKLKYNLSQPMKYGASETGIDYDEKLPRYIRITDITSDNKLKSEGKLSLTLEQANNYILAPNTVLFARSGGTVGKTFLFTEDYGVAAFAGYLISAVTDKTKMISKWLWYYTLSNSYWEWANRIFTQATIPNIGADKYSNMPIVVPDIDTQQLLITYLDQKCTEIDSIIDQKKEQLTVLENYKKSLIYEYVTGKKEVPAQ